MFFGVKMDDLYDVIVIGAGNAGLCAAITTLDSGYKTLLVDKNLYPGGCATSFCRGRFEFEPSLHELANVGTEENPGSVRKMFEQYGLDINWHVDEVAFHVISEEYDVTMPVGTEAFCREMENIVPGSYDSVKAVFRLGVKANEGLHYLASGKIDPAVLMSEHRDFLVMASHSVDECLDALKMPKKAQHILNTYWSYVGAPSDRLDFLFYAIILDRYIGLGPAMPRMRSHELSTALEDTVRKKDGQILYNTLVDEILIKDGKAYGIRIGEKEIYGKKIITNCHPGSSFGTLINEKHLPERAVKINNARRNGAQFFTIYIGLCKGAAELGIKDYTTFLFDSPESVVQYENAKDPYKGFLLVNCLNCAFPDASEEGTCMLYFTQMLTGEILEGVQPAGYKKFKNDIAADMIRRYEEKTGIIITPYIEEIAISTPATFARYIATPGGTPYGYEISLWDSMIARTLNNKNEQIIGNLWFAGAHAERTDGYNSAYANGIDVAKRVIRELKAQEGETNERK